MKSKACITIPEMAKLLGISRIAVFKKVKSGKIQAVKVWRNYVIPAKQKDKFSGGALIDKQKEEIKLSI
jgi:excisionase family DNA binding protein